MPGEHKSFRVSRTLSEKILMCMFKVHIKDPCLSDRITVILSYAYLNIISITKNNVRCQCKADILCLGGMMNLLISSQGKNGDIYVRWRLASAVCFKMYVLTFKDIEIYVQSWKCHVVLHWWCLDISPACCHTRNVRLNVNWYISRFLIFHQLELCVINVRINY